MRIKKLRVLNYKSYSDSGWIEFADGFNVVVGKNSSGKSALLEALRFSRASSRPHLSLKRRRGTPLPPTSTFELEAAFAKNELKDAALRLGDVHIPFQIGHDNQELAQSTVNKVLEVDGITLHLSANAQGVYTPLTYPSHRLFSADQNPAFAHVQANQDRSSYKIAGVSGGASDSGPALMDDLARRKVYVFRAERLNLGETGFHEAHILDESASNLPQVLFSLNTNPSAFDRFNRHVNEIFPYIKRVTVFPKGSNIDVRLWWVDPNTEREDLAVPLQESGTGVGQALAILYVAMTIENGVIAIDEPNSFLHPGAAKKLIEILSQYDHQYIISTHSSEIIAVSNPNAVFTVHWNEGDTKVEKIERLNLASQKAILAEIGVSAVDVFGADKIIWVEGETEEDCFPLVLQRERGALPAGLDFIAVRSVDEIARKQKTDALILEIYQKLSTEAALSPKLLRFSFDKEQRSEEYVAKIGQDTKGKVRFLPARHYECFLLNESAISAVLSGEAKTLNRPPVSANVVREWVSKNAPNYSGRSAWSGSLENLDWRKNADAANLLKAIFYDLLTLEYSKTKHSRALTEWLLEEEPEVLKELSKYVSELLE